MQEENEIPRCMKSCVVCDRRFNVALEKTDRKTCSAECLSLLKRINAMKSDDGNFIENPSF